MKHQNIYIGVLTYLTLLLVVGAYDNSTSTEEYRLLTNGKILHAPIVAHENAMGQIGGRWIFWAVFPFIPYTMLWLSHRNLFTANAMLMMFAVVYHYLIPSVAAPAIALLVIFSTTSTLFKVFTPYFSN